MYSSIFVFRSKSYKTIKISNLRKWVADFFVFESGQKRDKMIFIWSIWRLLLKKLSRMIFLIISYFCTFKNGKI